MCIPMKVALALAAACVLVAEPSEAAKKKAAAAQSGRISIAYVAPKDPAHQRMYQRLQEVRFLEKLKEVMSPVRLPRRLKVITEGCDGEANAWYDDDAITICYEYIDEMWKNAPAETTPEGVAPIDAVIGPVFDTAMHEFGHALFDMLRIPVFGREEDAADQVAAYITLQLGKEEARRLIGGTAYAYYTEAKAIARPALAQFANEHGLPAQRFFNLLCIAYGADPKAFGNIIERGYLPKDRAENCESEYKQAAYAFEKLIRPHVDFRLAKKVMNKSWLPEPTKRIHRRADSRPSAQSK
jgi:hypothetical protein